MKQRGNKGWSTAPNAGRPATRRGPRQNHTVRAYAEEWETIRRFVEHRRRHPEWAERVADMLDNLAELEHFYRAEAPDEAARTDLIYSDWLERWYQAHAPVKVREEVGKILPFRRST